MESVKIFSSTKQMKQIICTYYKWYGYVKFELGFDVPAINHVAS